jgi:hypothetical protein
MTKSTKDPGFNSRGQKIRTTKKGTPDRRGGDHGGGRTPIYGKAMNRHTIRIADQHEALIARVNPTNFNAGILAILDNPEIVRLIQSNF